MFRLRFWGKWFAGRAGRPSSKPRRGCWRLEQLEERLVPSISVTIQGPTLGTISNDNQPTVKAQAMVSGGPSIADVQFEYSSNGGVSWADAGSAQTMSPYAYTFPPLPDGAYLVRAVAMDNAGDTASSDWPPMTNLATFTGAPGAIPAGGVITDSAGNIYGTTAVGGASDYGTVFEIGAGGQTVTTRGSFNYTNGTYPESSLALDKSGNLFGTAITGGANNQGTVFEIGAGSNQITLLATFNGHDGSNPEGSVYIDSNDDVFGTSYFGGPTFISGGGDGNGVVWEVANGTGTVTDLGQFNVTNGANPTWGLVADSQGDLFGAAGSGGDANGDGVVFEIMHGTMAITDIAQFNGANGSNPLGVVLDSAGDLFGDTVSGTGANNGNGTIFEIASGTGTITNLANFGALSGYPEGGLTMDGEGNLFGTTYGESSASDYGSVFEVASGTDTITSLAFFTGTSNDSAYPISPPVELPNGNLVGANPGQAGTVNPGGGASGNTFGSIYELTPNPAAFSIDTTAPVATITSHPPATTSNTSATFTFTGYDPTVGGVSSGVAYYQYQIDGGGYITATSPVTLTGLSQGSHTFQVRDVDNAGNVGSPASYTWTIAAVALSGVAVNGSTAPILSATASGGNVTITTDGPSGFTAGQSVLIAGVNGTGTASGYNGAYPIVTVSGNSFTYADGGATGSSSGNGTATTSAAAGALTNGSTNFNSQRSMVDSIVYTFNQAVSLGAGAISLTATGQGGVAPTVAYASPDGGFTWVVTFSGSSVTGNSIANGEYQIVLNASAVSATGGGSGLAANDTETFYRLYGDTVGNGHQRVNTSDTNAFLGAFNTRSTSAAFLAYLDFADTGRVNTADTNAFLGDFNIQYKNFTAAI